TSTVTTCEPAEPPAPVACDAGSAQLYGDAACTPIGTACPPSGWPDNLPAGAVIYVRAGAAPRGDGSLARPFAPLNAALPHTPSGATIAVGVGTLSDRMITLNGVTLIGACASGTHLLAADPTVPALISVGPLGATVKNFDLGGAGSAILDGYFAP